MKLENILRNLGLSENEAKIYLATLEMGISPAQDIARKAGIIRTTGYSVLEKLVKKNFIHKTKEKNKTRYLAEEPKNLIKRFEEYQKELEKSLPELQAIYNKHETKPKIVFFEGKGGIEEIYDDTIKEKPQEILEYNTSDMFVALPEFPMDYVKRRQKNKIHAKRIAPDDKYWKKHALREKVELSRTILLPPKDFTIPVEINIYNNKVAFMSYSDEMGIIIESHGVASAMRRIYELFWEKLEKNKK
ncbi:MAG: helix-turn-helix domain-containing protein [bacterium]